MDKTTNSKDMVKGLAADVSENTVDTVDMTDMTDMTDTTVMFDDQNWIIWSDDVYINMEEVKKGSYAIAKSMRWRITE